MDSIERPPSVPHYSYPQTAIHKLRAGSSRVREAVWLFLTIWMLQQQSAGFQPVRQAPPPPHRQLFGGTASSPRKSSCSKSSQPGASLQMERPSAVPHQEYISLTKEERRNLPDPRDRLIQEKGHPHLRVGYNQVDYKTPKHGSEHDLPTNERDRTPKTEQNALALRDSIVNMPNREKIVWFENGGYQKGTDRGYDSVNLYDPETRVIGVFRKEGNGKLSRFTITGELTLLEHKYLYASGGNFMTEANLNQQNELPIQTNFMRKKKELIMTYTKKKHIELLKSFLDFRKQGKSIYDLYLEKRNEYLEFSRYQSMVSDCIFWRRRKEFVLWMENYVNDSIDFEDFEIAFSQLWSKSITEDKALEIDLKGLQNFEFDPQSHKFCSLVTSIFRQFEVLEDEECTEQDVKDYVRNILPEIQPYL